MCICVYVCPCVFAVCVWKKLFVLFSLVYFYCFLLQRWEALMRVHQHLPPDNKYQSTKPINSVIAGEHRFVGNYALRMVLNPPPPKSPTKQAPHSAMCCSSYGSPNRTSKATERVGMGAGPIKGKNTRHKRLLSDQPSRVEPGVVFQLWYRRLPVCPLEERRRALSACWEDCCFLLYWTWITRKYNNGSCLFSCSIRVGLTLQIVPRGSKDICKRTTFWTGH